MLTCFLRIAFLYFGSFTSRMGMAPTCLTYSTRPLNSNTIMKQKCRQKGTGAKDRRQGITGVRMVHEEVEVGLCSQRPGEGQEFSYSAQLWERGARKLGNKQKQHRSLQRWQLKKEQAQTFSLCVKDVSGSLNKVNASVIKLMHSLLSPCICLFCLSVLSLAAYVGVVERQITRLVCLLSYMTLNKLLNPQASVIHSVNWEQEHLP